MEASTRGSPLEARISREIGYALYGLLEGRPMVAVFGSARAAPESDSYARAQEVARSLGRAGFGIITGGGPGIMEAANRGARASGVPSLGASIVLPREEASNEYLDREVRFEFFFARKLALVRAACGFLCFPGGFGTVDELFEALTLVQTGKLPHFPIVLFGSTYWSPLIEWLTETMVDAGVIAVQDRGLLLVTDDPTAAIERFRACHHTLCSTLGTGPHYPELSVAGTEAYHGYV